MRMGNLIWSSKTNKFYTSSNELAIAEKVSKNTVNWHLNTKKILPSKKKYKKVKILYKPNQKIYKTLQEASKDTLLTMAEIYSDIFSNKKMFDYVIPHRLAQYKMIQDRQNKKLLKEVV